MSSALSSRSGKRNWLHPLEEAGSRAIVGLFLLGLLTFGLAGCSMLPAGRLPSSSLGPVAALVDGVPFFPQEELQCGPASLAMVMNWSGVDVQPSALSPEIFTPGLQGSLQSALVGAARRHGRVAYPIFGSEALLAEIAAGHPVIVLVNLGLSWYPKWHYAVAIGYDREAGEVILHSGRTPNERLTWWLFMNIWQRSDFWGLLVLPASSLPATADEGAWLAAVAGLEHVGQWQEASVGYGTAITRWPGNGAAWMGLGNSLYQKGDLAGAERSFREATRLQPENGAAWNNMAHVLVGLGRRAEALAAARQAVALGGVFSEQARQTLREIEVMPLR